MSKQEKQEVLHEAYNTLFKDSVATNIVLEDLCTYCGLDRTSFHSDAGVMAFNEGQRSVILYILECLNITPKKQVQSSMEDRLPYWKVSAENKKIKGTI